MGALQENSARRVHLRNLCPHPPLDSRVRFVPLRPLILEMKRAQRTRRVYLDLTEKDLVKFQDYYYISVPLANIASAEVHKGIITVHLKPTAPKLIMRPGGDADDYEMSVLHLYRLKNTDEFVEGIRNAITPDP